MAVLENPVVEVHNNLLAVGWGVVDEVVMRKDCGQYAYFRTASHGSVLVKTTGRSVRAWLEFPAPVAQQGLLYRLMSWRDEDPLQSLGALFPKNVFGECTAEGHIRNGNRPSFKGSRFVSMSKDVRGVHGFLRGLIRHAGLCEQTERLVSHGVIAVASVERLASCGVRVIDAAPHMKGRLARNFAAASGEVLVDGEIPERCLVDLLDVDEGLLFDVK